MIRSGVHGSRCPGFRASGIFKAMAGSHKACTPGELAGSTAPNRRALGA